jgi:hypothetical protein
MKKVIILKIGFIFFLLNVSGQNVKAIKLNSNNEIKQKLDSLVLVNELKNEFTYDFLGNNIQSIDYNWKNNQWMPTDKNEKTYTSNGKNALINHFNWENNQWVLYSKYEYIYDNNGNKTQEIYYRWYSDNWKPSSKSEYDYNSNGNITQAIDYKWQNNQWIPDFLKYEFIYNSIGNIFQRRVYLWQNNQWEITSEIEYIYDIKGNNTQSINYNWKNNQWEFAAKQEYIFDSNGNYLQDIGFSWQSNKWEFSWKEELLWDINSNTTQAINFDWGNNKWVPKIKQEYSYDLSYNLSDLNFPLPDFPMELAGSYINKPINLLAYTWDANSNNWINKQTLVYYYSEQNIVSVSDKKNVILKVYPNPAIDKIYINCADLQDLKMNIYNIVGDCVFQSNLTMGINVIDLNSLIKGIYFIRLTGGDKNIQQKLIKE